MKHIKLKSPFPKKNELFPKEFHYPILSISYLPKPSNSYYKIKFIKVLESRFSRRKWGPITAHDLSSLLWYVAKTKNTYKEESGFVSEHRNVPSAGGRHPVDLLIIRHLRKKITVDLYNPRAHALMRVKVANSKELVELSKKVKEILPGKGTLIWLVGQFGRTMSKYVNGESLVWLDGGALLGTIYLVTEAFQLNCCAIGITGEPWVSNFLRSDSLVEGLCGCIIGSRE